MNSVGAIALWATLQVTMFAAAGCIVYLVARRRGPAAGSAAAVTALLILIAVSALALSPWPRWWNLAIGPDQEASTQPIENAAIKGGVANAATASANRADASTAVGAENSVAGPSGDRPNNAGLESISQVFWTAMVDNLQAPAAEETDPAWRWPAWLAAIVAAGVLVALVRVGIGLSAVHWYRRKTQPVNDAQLQTLIDSVCRDMGCTRTIEARQSLHVSSPATIGLVKPLLLLPAHWRDWSETERRVVVAHEVAHICRGDYASWLMAQLSLALHFYHPLVHWLVARLRVEQEVAADHLAAAVAGGRSTYLATLAQMALREDDRAVRWAARPFLPSRGTFLRRIAMLRDTRQRSSTPLGWSGRSIVLASLIAVGVVIAGIRGPDMAVAQQNGKSKSAENRRAGGADKDQSSAEKFSLQYVPSDAAVVMTFRPAELLSVEGMAPIRDLLRRENPLEDELGFPITDLEEVTVVVSDFAGPPGRIIVRSNKDVDWKAFGEKKLPNAKEATLAGKKYFTDDASDPNNFSYHIADERTFIWATEREMRELLSDDGPADGAWATAWKEMADGQFAVMQDVAAALVAMPQQAAREPMVAPFMPLLEQTRFVVLAAGTEGESVEIKALAETRSEDAAQRVADTAKAAMTLGRNSLPMARRQMGQAPPEVRKLMLDLLDTAESVLKQDEFEIKGKTVHWEAKAEGALAAPVLATLLPAIQKARAAARRVQSTNNLKQIALAFHMFHDVNKRLPASAMLGPDGKTLHSWRVAILPYIEQDALYKQYKFDEPWDSENNRKLIDKMPAIYRVPTEDEKSTSANYYVITGKDTMFFDNKGTDFSKVLDGLSNTLLAVEAKRDIPWTKPEDIPYDPDKDLPKLGGFFDGFNAAMGDGSVRFFMETLDPNVLRALITRAGGETPQGF